jgi:hypothetical protein
MDDEMKFYARMFGWIAIFFLIVGITSHAEEVKKQEREAWIKKCWDVFYDPYEFLSPESLWYLDMYYWKSCPDDDPDYVAEYRCNWYIWRNLANCLADKLPRVSQWCETYRDQKSQYDSCVNKFQEN